MGPCPRVCGFKGRSVCQGGPYSLGQGPIQGSSVFLWGPTTLYIRAQAQGLKVPSVYWGGPCSLGQEPNSGPCIQTQFGPISTSTWAHKFIYRGPGPKGGGLIHGPSKKIPWFQISTIHILAKGKGIGKCKNVQLSPCYWALSLKYFHITHCNYSTDKP